MAEETADQLSSDAKLTLSTRPRGTEASQDGRVRDPAGGVGLWIEEQFGVGDAAMLVRYDLAKQRAALVVPRHGASRSALYLARI